MSRVRPATPPLPTPYPGDPAELSLDYIAASYWIDERLGYRQRDAHDHFPAQGSYLDFWHYVLEWLGDDWHNDGYVPGGPHSFEEMRAHTLEKYGPEDWRSQIAAVWAREYPLRYQLWMSW